MAEFVKYLFFDILQNVYVLPPGHGRAAGVDVVGLLPVGSDDLLN